jgi:hypothetical protein
MWWSLHRSEYSSRPPDHRDPKSCLKAMRMLHTPHTHTHMCLCSHVAEHNDSGSSVAPVIQRQLKRCPLVVEDVCTRHGATVRVDSDVDGSRCSSRVAELTHTSPRGL